MTLYVSALQMSDSALWSARRVKEWMIRNPARYDTPKTREILASHVRSARKYSHLALKYRRANA